MDLILRVLRSLLATFSYFDRDKTRMKCIVSDIIYIGLDVIKNILVIISWVLKRLMCRVSAMISAVNQMSASKV